MTREIRLVDLTEHEKANAILVLSGYSRKLKATLEEIAKRNGYARRRLDDLLKEYEPRLGFLERAYSRSVTVPGDVAREAARNDRLWKSAEALA